jgi:N-acetylglucosamine malate deacetylase 2
MKARAARAVLDWLSRGRGTAPRLVVVGAHPDDETIGAGGRLRQFRNASFVCVTDGAPRDPSDTAAAGFQTPEHYAAARRAEFGSVLSAAGIKRSGRHLNYVDQETSINLNALTQTLADLLRELEPEVILTQPYEGGHPDHDATAFAVHRACQLMERSGGRAPLIVEMTSYHSRSGTMETATFLPSGSREEVTTVLSDEERRFKATLFQCYRTQQQVLQSFPIAIERFRIAPDYDFTEPPHAGRLFYENFNWGMTGARWRHLARRSSQPPEIVCA